MFLSIETKADTPQRLAAIAGKPTKNYLFSSEINKMVATIKNLQLTSGVNSSNIAYILSRGTSYDLGEITESFLTILNTSETFELLSGDYITFQTAGIKYVYVFVGQSNYYGAGQATLTEYDFLLIYQSDSPVNPEQPSKFFKALLSQTGTSNPTAVVHKNDIGTYTLIRPTGHPGEFYFTCPGAFPINKTYPKIWSTNNVTYLSRRMDNDTILIMTTSEITGGIDGYLDGTPFEIEIMP